MREYHLFSNSRKLSLILLSSLLLISIRSSSAFSTVSLNSSYSQIVFFDSASYTRFEVQFKLNKSIVYTNETNKYSLSITPQIQTSSSYYSSNITLERVVIGDITLDFYEEGKETLSASTPLFYCNTQGGIEPLVVSYGNTTTITGNFTFPDWWRKETVQLGLFLGYSEELTIIDYGEHSTCNSRHFPKLFGPLSVTGFPLGVGELIFFSQMEILISSLVVILMVIIFFLTRKIVKKKV